MDILIVVYNALQYFKLCYWHLLNSEGIVDVNILVLDNASSDPDVAGFLRLLKNPKLVKMRSDINLGFTAGMNLLLRHSISIPHSEYVVFLNPDAMILTRNWISIARNFMEQNPTCGVLGGLCLFEDRYLVNSFGAYLPPNATVNRPCAGQHALSHLPKAKAPHRLAVDYIPFSFAVTRKSLIKEVGKLDERFFHAYSDCAFCLQAKSLGYYSEALRDIEVVHDGGASSRSLNMCSVLEK